MLGKFEGYVVKICLRAKEATPPQMHGESPEISMTSLMGSSLGGTESPFIPS